VNKWIRFIFPATEHTGKGEGRVLLKKKSLKLYLKYADVDTSILNSKLNGN
jgi:hypothetical protein